MISVIIITKNEALHIERCLASVTWADEIIVLDSGSSDATVALCQRYSTQVFSTDWPGFGAQKQRALDKAQGEWVLSLDADEVVSPELQAEIKQAINTTTYQGFAIPRLSRYCGRAMQHSGWWPDYVLRLVRREQAHFTQHPVHERCIVQGAVGRLTHPLLHEAFIDLDEVLTKVNHYSSLGAEMLYQRGVRASLSTAIVRGVWTFIRTYFLHAGFLDGTQGLMLAISNAEGTYYKYAKLWALHQAHSDNV